MRFRILSCIACILITGLAGAQPSGRAIHGTVRDQLGYVVAGAHITLQGSGYEHAVTSARDGSFRFEGAPIGPLKVSVDATGFGHFSVVEPADKDQIDIELKPASISQEINVTANRVGTVQAETAESISILSRSDLDSAAAETVDEVLRRFPALPCFDVPTAAPRIL